MVSKKNVTDNFISASLKNTRLHAEKSNEIELMNNTGITVMIIQ